MKSILLSVSALLLSTPALATTPQEFIRNYQSTHGVQCRYDQSSKNEYCLNYTCQYKKYYTCENDSDLHVLVLKVRSIRYPGETSQDSVIGYSVQ